MDFKSLTEDLTWAAVAGGVLLAVGLIGLGIAAPGSPSLPAPVREVRLEPVPPPPAWTPPPRAVGGPCAVNTSVVNFRAGPSTRRKRLRTVRQGQVLRCLELAGDWYRVADREGLEGYVHESLLDDLTPGLEGQARKLEQQGRYTEAAAAWERAVGLGLETPEAWQGLASNTLRSVLSAAAAPVGKPPWVERGLIEAAVPCAGGGPSAEALLALYRAADPGFLGAAPDLLWTGAAPRPAWAAAHLGSERVHLFGGTLRTARSTSGCRVALTLNLGRQESLTPPLEQAFRRQAEGGRVQLDVVTSRLSPVPALSVWEWVGFVLLALLVASTVAVPIFYGRALFRIYDGGGGRTLALAPAVGLVILIFADLLYLSAGALLPEGAAISSLPRGLAAAAIDHPLGRQLLRWAAEVLPADLSWHWPVFLGVLGKSALIAPFALFARGLRCRRKGREQPAFRSYVRGEMFPDGWALAGESGGKLLAAGRGLTSGLEAVSTAVTFLALLPAVLFAAVWLPLVQLGLGIFLAAAWLLVGFSSFLLASVERAVMRVRTGYAKCPHAGCHRPVPQPVFQCPSCRAKHDRLLPGRFGVFYRRCQCGQVRLPTLFVLGKGRGSRGGEPGMRNLCPHCDQPIDEELFAGNVHLPIYGGTSAGKTMLMFAASWQLLDEQLAGVSADLILDSDRQAYRQTWRPAIETGQVRPKTTEVLPRAFPLSLRRGAGLPVSLYLFDPAGEAMSGVHLPMHHFLRYYDGLMLLIDPLSLDSFAERYRRAGGPDLSPTTSPMAPDDVLDQIVNALEDQSGLERGRRFGRPLAVVLTKADIPGFKEELGLKLDEGLPGERWQSCGEAQSGRIREWLADNEPGLLQNLETRFENLRFFVTSALGHLPEPGKAFQPKQVLVPFLWLLSRRPALVRPLLARIGLRAAEVGAVVGVVLVFVGLPWWVLTSWILPLFGFR